MKRAAIILIALAAAYLASGFYIVRGNERAALRQFGRAQRSEDGELALRSSGLHYTLPWPFATIDRVRLNEIRTLSIGVSEGDQAGEGILQSLEVANQSQFLTGDKNVLNLVVSVQYRISERTVEDYLFRAKQPEQALVPIVESVATSLVARSGVDFVHPLGQVELNGLLTSAIRELTASRRLGLEVDDVAINSVFPPVQVKFDFLDVTSARADKVNYVNAANAYSEQRLAVARGEERQIQDRAAGEQQRVVESAKAEAESFSRLIAQFREEQRSGLHSYEVARQTAMRRYYLETMRDVLKSVSAKVLLDSPEPADLTIFGKPAATPAPQRSAPASTTAPR